jgi:hypothetical protein
VLRPLLILVLMCLLTSGSSEAQEADPHREALRKGHPARIERPRIPTENFEWNGTFRVPGQDVPVITDLTLRGMWQAGYFNVYLGQGVEGSDYWVENLIYQNHLYTITHAWPGVEFPVSGACYKSLEEITVRGLNGILASAQLVGLETIDGTPMNHFRASCLSQSRIVIVLNGTTIPLTQPITVNIFSDIYVRPGHARPFERWLQFGDAVGLSKQHDEWFFFTEWNSAPRDFQLPWQCQVPILVSQAPCSNLTPRD